MSVPRFADDGILGEEFGALRETATYRWMLNQGDSCALLAILEKAGRVALRLEKQRTSRSNNLLTLA